MMLKVKKGKVDGSGVDRVQTGKTELLEEDKLRSKSVILADIVPI